MQLTKYCFRATSCIFHLSNCSSCIYFQLQYEFIAFRRVLQPRTLYRFLVGTVTLSIFTSCHQECDANNDREKC